MHAISYVGIVLTLIWFVLLWKRANKIKVNIEVMGKFLSTVLMTMILHGK